MSWNSFEYVVVHYISRFYITNWTQIYYSSTIKGRRCRFWIESENLVYPLGFNNAQKIIQLRLPVVRKTLLFPVGKPQIQLTLLINLPKCFKGGGAKKVDARNRKGNTKYIIYQIFSPSEPRKIQNSFLKRALIP